MSIFETDYQPNVLTRLWKQHHEHHWRFEIRGGFLIATCWVENCKAVLSAAEITELCNKHAQD